MLEKYEANIYNSREPRRVRTRVFEATCFEEAVSRAYVWRSGIAGNVHEWKFNFIRKKKGWI